MRTEDFPIDSGSLREFIRINTPVWEGTQGDPDKAPIVICLSMVRMQVGWVLPKLLYAKGAASVRGGEVIALTWRTNPELEGFFRSFGIRHIALEDLIRKDPRALCRALGKTLQAFCCYGSGAELQKLHFSGLPVGTSLYEDILRTSSLSTIRSTRSMVALKKIFHLAWSFYALEHFVEKRGITLGVMDDVAYHEGIFARLFLSKGADCVSSNHVSERGISVLSDGTFDRDLWNLRSYYEEKLPALSEEALEEADRLLEGRFSGANGRKIDVGAFSGKLLGREELEKSMGLKPGRKNVFIMAHTFSDGVMNQGRLYFRDYYDWLEQTLIHAGNVTDVNWILKPHPTRAAYNEGVDSVEKMYERLKKPNIYLFPDQVNAASLVSLADVTVTIGGNAGLEYACLGIPAVITGKPFYHGFGVTIEPKTLAEYEEVLQGIGSIERLSEQQIRTAKQLFYLRNKQDQLSEAFYRDAFVSVNNGQLMNMVEHMALAFFADNSGTNPYNTKNLEEITDWMKENDLRDTEYYKRGQRKGAKR